MRPPSSNPVARLAFTLIELLVVITVISLLLAFSAPALFNGLQASRLSGAGEKMVSALSEAQQTAFSQNCVIEVQFYAYEGVFEASRRTFRSYRIFKVTSPNSSLGTTTENVISVGAINKLPDGVMISSDKTLSPALTGAPMADSKQNSGQPNALYAAMRFLPDGTCRSVSSTGTGRAVLSFLPLPASFFTMIEDDGQDYTATNLPANFFTIQTDHFTGKSRSYRPGF